MPITTTPSGGPQGEFSTYTPIYAQTLSSATASVTFSNIPTTYTDLVLVFQGTVATNGQSIIVRFNSDSGSNYSRTHLRGASTSSESVRVSSTTASWLSYGAGVSSTAQCGGTMTIQNYANTTTYKPVLTKFSNVSGSAGAGIEYGINGWMSTSAITSLTIAAQSGNMNSGCMFTLYGIKAAAPAPKATGGDVVVTDGTYWYHTFKTSGILDVKTSMTVDYLVVAGGGGGGSADGVNDAAAGGGGAGGFRTGSGISVSAQSYTITVGAGGAGSTIRTSAGTNGGNSQFATISSTGGGGGGSGGSNNGIAGGSGGGSRGYSGTGGSGNAGSYSPVEGYAGGTATTTKDSGSGGGGSSAAGNQASTNTFGGTGGAGTASSITGTSITYAGGGGGGSYNTNNTASGGSGGGGTGGGGSNPGGTNPTNGTANLGGGGGGGYANANYVGSDGANGGSGVVVVRYAV